MKSVNIQEAKTHLSRFVELAANGEPIVIAKAGKPLAVLTAWKPDTAPRTGGGWTGKAWIAEDFNLPSPVIEEMFVGIEEVESLGMAEGSPELK